jgi:hypothetical protein
MRCCIVTATGWSLEYIDNLPWRYVALQSDYWCVHPPVHLLVQNIAAAFGIRVGNTKRSTELTKVEKKYMDEMPAQSWSKLPAGVQDSMAKLIADARKGKVENVGNN